MALIVVALVSGCTDADASAPDPALRSVDDLYAQVAAIVQTDDETRRAIEDETFACMRRRGFEYQPYVPPLGTSDTDAPMVDSLARTLKRVVDGSVDPNQAYYDELQMSDPLMANEWLEALWGKDGALLTVGETVPEDLDLADPDLGCQSIAAFEVIGVEQTNENIELINLSMELDNRVKADPRIVSAQREVDRCTVLADLDGLRHSFEKDFDALAYADPEPTGAELDTALDELRTKELALARVVDACREDAGFDELWAEVELEVFNELT